LGDLRLWIESIYVRDGERDGRGREEEARERRGEGSEKTTIWKIVKLTKKNNTQQPDCTKHRHSKGSKIIVP
jgi:hypothetical protein